MQLHPKQFEVFQFYFLSSICERGDGGLGLTLRPVLLRGSPLIIVSDCVSSNFTIKLDLLYCCLVVVVVIAVV